MRTLKNTVRLVALCMAISLSYIEVCYSLLVDIIHIVFIENDRESGENIRA